MTVFLSYSRSDHDVVERISHRLIANDIVPWQDKSRLAPGAMLTDSILDEIRKASYFCVVLSKKSVKSAWVAKELDAALARPRTTGDNFLLPLLVEDCEIPAPLREVNQIDLRSDFDAGMNKLIGYVGRKYNTNLSGRLEDGKDYCLDWLISTGTGHGRGSLTIDMAGSNIDASYSNVVHIRVEGPAFATAEVLEPESAGEPTAHILRLLVEHYSGKARWLILVGNSVKEDRWVLHGIEEGAVLDVYVRVLRLGQLPKNVQLFDLQKHLMQICKEKGIALDAVSG